MCLYENYLICIFMNINKHLKIRAKPLHKLEFMFMKHYAPNRCEPSIEVIMKIGRVGGVRVDLNKELKFF